MQTEYGSTSAASGIPSIVCLCQMVSLASSNGSFYSRSFTA